MEPTNEQGVMTRYPMPFVRVDLVLLCVRHGSLQVLLSHRKEMPFKNSWGLPGGVLRIDLDVSLEDAAQRVAQTRLHQVLPNLSQVATVGGAQRDPRAPWAMSVVYRSMVQSNIETSPGKRVQALEWRPVDEVVRANALAFDHAQLIGRAVEATRQEIKALRFPPGWLPEEFTLSELQAISEVVLGAPIDKVTFRRRIALSVEVKAREGRMRMGSAYRPAQLYALI
jgi:8-oxo-dGTP diphosphatase